MGKNTFELNADLLSKGLYPELATLVRHVYPSKTELPLFEEKRVEEIPFEETDVLYIFGLALSLPKAVKNWLEENENHFIVFLEDDLDNIATFLDNEEATFFVQNPQVYICYFQGIEDAKPLLYRLCWHFVGLNTRLFSVKKESEHLHFLESTIPFMVSDTASSFSSTVDFGAPFYNNFYKNLPQLNFAHSGDSLFGKLRNTPAIICGAGPSLKEAIPQLKQLSQKAIIFAGGSAITALTASSIPPHLAVAIDPTPLLLKHVESHQGFELPLFYRPRMHHQALKTFHGPLLHITGSGRYKVSDWFEEELDIQKGEELFEGISVSTFSLSLAIALGCNPIIFSGMDLSYRDGRMYTEGVTETPSLPPISYEGCSTNWKWITEAHWITDFVSKNSKHTFYNATIGGLPIKGVPFKPLDILEKEVLKNKYDIQGRINGIIHNAPPCSSDTLAVAEATNRMAKSLQSCMAICEGLLEEIFSLQEQIETTQTAPDLLSTGEQALLEVELEEEIAYQYILSPLLDYYSRSMDRRSYRIRREANEKETAQTALRKLNLEIEKLLFLTAAAQTNQFLIEASQKK